MLIEYDTVLIDESDPVAWSLFTRSSMRRRPCDNLGFARPTPTLSLSSEGVIDDGVESDSMDIICKGCRAGFEALGTGS